MISAVIVNWNSGPLLERCVSSLLEHAGGCEIITVDNASEDSSADFLNRGGDSVIVVRSSRNLGFAAAANLAWKRSLGEFILFLNPDTVCLPNSVRRLAEPLEQEADVWAAGGMLQDTSCRPQTGFNVRAFPTLGSVAAEMLLLDEVWPGNFWTRHYRLSGWMPGTSCDAYQPAAACLMVSRKAMTALGGFDEVFHPAWFEDVDLCRRIWRSGGRIRFVPGARFIHRGGYCLDRLGQEQFLEYFHTNQIRYFAKHYGAGVSERVRRIVIAGLCLRAALRLILRPSRNSSNAASAAVFWRAARHFRAMREVR